MSNEEAEVITKASTIVKVSLLTLKHVRFNPVHFPLCIT